MFEGRGSEITRCRSYQAECNILAPLHLRALLCEPPSCLPSVTGNVNGTSPPSIPLRLHNILPWIGPSTASPAIRKTPIRLAWSFRSADTMKNRDGAINPWNDITLGLGEMTSRYTSIEIPCSKEFVTWKIMGYGNRLEWFVLKRTIEITYNAQRLILLLHDKCWKIPPKVARTSA